MSSGYGSGGFQQGAGYPPPQQPQMPGAMPPGGGGGTSEAKTSGLAIAGLVLSIIFCIPIFPLLGVIFGIVSLIKITKEPERLRGKGLAIAAIVVGVVAVVPMGISAAVSVPAFVKYIRRAKTAEAEDRLSQMYRAAVSYYNQEQVSRETYGRSLEAQFPVSTQLTPARRCCDSGENDGRCPVNLGQWDSPTWQALNFSISEPHYYQYQFISDGQSFTARAIGDLDCDGVFSTFERSGMVDENGDVVGSRGIYRNLPTE